MVQLASLVEVQFIEPEAVEMLPDRDLVKRVGLDPSDQIY